MTPPPLATSVVTARGVTPARYALFLHGILGSGQNWRGLARKVCQTTPELGVVLVDLRHHGRSRGAFGPPTVAGAAADLVPVAAALPAPVTGVLGHSFGGKVALAFVRAHGEGLRQAWIVDSLPGARPDRRGSEGTSAIVAMLRDLRGPFDARDDFVARVMAHGHGEGLARWLAMNLERREDGRFVLDLDLDAIAALLDDYFRVDLWSVVESPPPDLALHLVVGGASPVFTADDLARARAAADARPNVDVTVIPGAGHWVHADAPDALVAVLVRPPDE